MKTFFALFLLAVFTLASTDAEARRRHHRPHNTSVEFSRNGSDYLVNALRRDIGTNPTGMRRRWCALYLRQKIGGETARFTDNRAISFLRLPRVRPYVGAIAVLRNHVGVVSGFDGRGGVYLVSGNHSRRVGEGRYAASRIIAYVQAI